MAGITNSTTLTNQFQNFFSKELLSIVQQETILDQFATKATIPKNNGNQAITMFRFGSPSVADVKTLTEGTAIGSANYRNLVLNKLTKSLSQYGQVIGLTDILRATDLFNSLQQATKTSGMDMALWVDSVIRNTLVGTNLTASGMCESGKTFYVTYRAIMDQPISTTSFGYAPIMHCNYVQKISGFTDNNGLSYYLSARFPALAFPFMRRSTDFTSFTGYGWTCNKVQLLVAKVNSEDDMGLGYIPTNSWRAISDLTIGGNGIVSGSSYSATVDPSELIGHQFIVSNEDYVSGSTYDLSEHYPGFFTNTDYKSTTDNQLGLTYGNEILFPGVIKTVIAATAFNQRRIISPP